MDKGRRGFLAGLLGAPAAGLAMTQGDAALTSDDFLRGEWRFRWIDWQTLPATDSVYGLWIAEHPDGRMAHWTTRGRGDWHVLDYTFDLTGHTDWPHLSGGSSPQDLRAAKKRAFLSLWTFVHG